MNKFQQDAPIVQPAAAYSDKQFLHTYQTAALLPLTQSTITAFMATVGVFVVLFLFDAVDYIKPLLVTFCLVWVGTWLYLQRRWLNLTTLESRLHLDINRDGKIGSEPTGEVKSIRVQVDTLERNGHIHQSKLFTLPCSDAELAQIAEAYRRGIPFSEKEWTGKDKPFSVSRFREVRGEMIKRGMMAAASSKSDKQGFIFTKAGEAILDHYVPSPTPDVEEPESL